VKRILLADDEVNLRMLVELTLEDPEHEIHQASSGEMALDLAYRIQPDLVLLDWMMPQMSGIETARALRANPATSRIPIIMLTAKGQEKDRAQAVGLDLQGYLVKPFRPLELLDLVHRLLG
jgi:DNA-binding response OmpR family regulator